VQGVGKSWLFSSTTRGFGYSYEAVRSRVFNTLSPFQIAKAVIMHEAALKAQAKKMNVESLRAGDQSGESAEVKIAKVINFQGIKSNLI
jgi:hypothetical protein